MTSLLKGRKTETNKHNLRISFEKRGDKILQCKLNFVCNLGFDFKANDGIYTAFFNDFNSNGKVNIVLSAKTIEGTSKVREIKLVTTGATPLNFYEGLLYLF